MPQIFCRGRFWVQLCVVVALITFAGVLINNITVNLIRTGLGLDFGWPTEIKSQSCTNQIHGDVVDQHARKGDQGNNNAKLNPEASSTKNLRHQANGGAIIKPPSLPKRLGPLGMVTALPGPR